jgi:hypothetical protein
VRPLGGASGNATTAGGGSSSGGSVPSSPSRTNGTLDAGSGLLPSGLIPGDSLPSGLLPSGLLPDTPDVPGNLSDSVSKAKSTVAGLLDQVAGLI